MTAEPPDPAALRASYEGAELDESRLAADPVTQFGDWFAAAAGVGLPEPNAMILATVSPSGLPHARTVLLKGYEQDGFRFFTNHRSRKGQDLAATPQACLVFPWHAIHRQVIVEGKVTRLAPEESAAYFHSRPHGSQLGAWASERQSSAVSRKELDRRYAEVNERWPEGTTVPLPDFWGGYRVVPEQVEFWQGRTDRLHDRLRYSRTETGWQITRLSP